MYESKKAVPELIMLSPEYVDVFMQAVENASLETLLSNNSIFKKDNRTIEIYDTRAQFLIQVGREYQKLLNQKQK